MSSPSHVRSAIVVGGGPSGLIAAEVLATAGMKVTVFDHKRTVGRKFLLAGRGGLNITHSESVDEMLGRYGAAGSRLAPAFREFGPEALRTWCARLGEPTFVGSTGRIFPASFRATPLLRAWLRRLRELGVDFEVGQRWVGWGSAAGVERQPRSALFESADGSACEVRADVIVLALGGASWPRVGSDGGWVKVLRNAGVDVTDLLPTNCGLEIEWSRLFTERFSGVPLKNVAIEVDDRRIRGDAMITCGGLEGGPVYAVASGVRRAIETAGSCEVLVDLHPDIDEEVVERRLATRRPKESMSTLLRRSLRLSDAAVGLMREATGNELPDDPTPLAALVKAVPFEVTATMTIDRAISTAGGVAFAEIDESWMLRRVPGTFVAGEMLDWEAPTGGYLLQASFSTGVAAARGAIHWLEDGTMTQ